MTQIEKAKELINTFAIGDAEKAASLVAEGYIQHNLAYSTGRDAFVGSVNYLASAPVPTTVNTIRAYGDGDKVFYRRFTILLEQASRWHSIFFGLTVKGKLQSMGIILLTT